MFADGDAGREVRQAALKCRVSESWNPTPAAGATREWEIGTHVAAERPTEVAFLSRGPAAVRSDELDAMLAAPL